MQSRIINLFCRLVWGMHGSGRRVYSPERLRLAGLL
jgi:hypothetical protein